MLPEFNETGGGVILSVRVSTRSSSNAVKGVKDGCLKVSVTAVPEKGKANKAVFKLLSKLFGIPTTAVNIYSGGKSRNKAVFLSGISGKEVEECLKKATQMK